MIRTVRLALAPAFPARPVLMAPSPSVSLQKIALPTHVRSKISVAVEPTSRKKKKPRKYSSVPIDEATISTEKMKMQMIVKELNSTSVSLLVTASRTSSPKSAYNVSAVVSMANRQLSLNRRHLLRSHCHFLSFRSSSSTLGIRACPAGATGNNGWIECSSFDGEGLPENRAAGTESACVDVLDNEGAGARLGALEPTEVSGATAAKESPPMAPTYAAKPKAAPRPDSPPPPPPLRAASSGCERR
mmetsp:Transcript_96705/g.278289  ORF Transcript_96705/g.278289 Transcript_96705/m.278289 type:complete len:245 (-) Transcript_96705:171-905(-)